MHVARVVSELLKWSGIILKSETPRERLKLLLKSVDSVAAC